MAIFLSLWFILGGITLFVLLFYCMCEEIEWRYFVILFLIWISPLACAFYGDCAEKVMVYDYQYSIYALEDNSQIHGGRFYISEDTYYHHLAGYKDGLKMYKIPTNESYIVEDDKANPHIEVYTMTITKPNFMTKFMKIKLKGCEHEYKIVIPKNSIIKKYNVDMKN